MLDVVISGAMVYDGSGGEPFKADVIVVGDIISELVASNTVSRDRAMHLVDGTGLALAPGFIDLHQHGDFTIQGTPGAPSQVSQGVTTILTGNCGSSPFPAKSLRESAKSWRHLSPVFIKDTPTAQGFMRVVEESEPEINIAFQVGLSSLRRQAMGDASRAASTYELELMKREIDVAADAGVRGFSTGLIYAPGAYANPTEVTELVKHALRRGLLYSTHMRNEEDSLLESIDESISAIGHEGKLEISHLKSAGKLNHGKIDRAIERIETARSSGIDVTCDVYPYTASSTTLTAIFPDWSLDRGRSFLPARLANASDRSRIREALIKLFSIEVSPEQITISSLSDDGPGGYEWAIGKSLGEIAEICELEPADAAIAIVESHAAGVGMIHHSMSVADVDNALKYRYASVASDGHVMASSGSERPHPRNFGTFTRVLGHYVRERQLLSLSDAIRKMTSLPASRLGLDDRGVIVPGAKADLVLFDPASVSDRATFEDPWQLSTGVHTVLVNGVFALKNGNVVRGKGGQIV